MAKQEVEFAKMLDAAATIAYLEQVIAGLRGGQVLVQEGNASVSLAVNSPIQMEIEADFDSEKQKCSFEVKLEWRLEGAPTREEMGRRER